MLYRFSLTLNILYLLRPHKFMQVVRYITQYLSMRKDYEKRKQIKLMNFGLNHFIFFLCLLASQTLIELLNFQMRV